MSDEENKTRSITGVKFSAFKQVGVGRRRANR